MARRSVSRSVHNPPTARRPRRRLWPRSIEGAGMRRAAWALGLLIPSVGLALYLGRSVDIPRHSEAPPVTATPKAVPAAGAMTAAGPKKAAHIRVSEGEDSWQVFSARFGAHLKATRGA